MRAFSAAVALAIGSLSLAMIFRLERFRRGDGEDAGAGADIDDIARAPALEDIVEGEQAAARARVMRRAEGLARIDLDGEEGARHLSPVVAAVDEKAPGHDLAALALRQPDPIGGRKRFDLKRADAGSACRLGDQLEQGLARRRRVVMGEDLEAVFAALEQPDGDGGGVERLFERLGKAHRRRFRNLDPRLMRHPPRGSFD